MLEYTRNCSASEYTPASRDIVAAEESCGLMECVTKECIKQDKPLLDFGASDTLRTCKN